MKKRSDVSEFECLICSHYCEHEEKIKFKVIQNEKVDKFWRDVKKHVYSQDHTRNA